MARILIAPAASKTGVMLKDTGARDEHGMQPIEDMFSDDSPEKDTRNGPGETDSESEEEPMDIDEGESSMCQILPHTHASCVVMRPTNAP